MKSKFLGLLAVTLLAGPMVAQASLLNFRLSDGADTFTFELDSNPLPISFGATNTSFANIGVSVNGEPSLFTVTFFTLGQSGGLDISDAGDYLLGQSGPKLFTGPTHAPIFGGGEWALTDLADVDRFNGNYTLTVSVVSEPDTLALLGLGFAGLGLRRKRKAA